MRANAVVHSRGRQVGERDRRQAEPEYDRTMRGGIPVCVSAVVDTLRRRAANNAWSNLRLYRAVTELAPEEFLATNRTSFFPSIVETLNHILVVDWYYIDALERGGRGKAIFADMMPFRDAPSLARAQRASDERLVAFTNALADEAALSRIVELERDDHIQRESVLDTLLHLDVHQIHHRGQVHAMLSGTRVKPPQLDEFFMSEELPLREAELRALALPIR
jgi:uncharacterized damage-inducible protein DinB